MSHIIHGIIIGIVLFLTHPATKILFQRPVMEWMVPAQFREAGLTVALIYFHHLEN